MKFPNTFTKENKITFFKQRKKEMEKRILPMILKYFPFALAISKAGRRHARNTKRKKK